MTDLHAADLPELTIVAIYDMAYIKRPNGWHATGYDATEPMSNARMDGLLFGDIGARVLRVGHGS
ncbi:hypothetical protein ACWKSP_22205 [Micromonosporaceae bacterium Da 78-11]